MEKNKRARGFTLIELILTISILAVLISILVVALNPAEQLARARDAKRVADLDALKTGMNLYLAQATGTVNLSGTTTVNGNCIDNTSTYFTNTGAATSTGWVPAGFTAATSTAQTVATTSQSLANAIATGWMPALLGQTPGGAPIAVLPLDPTNGTGNSTSSYYAYACDASAKTFEFTARLESTYFKTDLNLIGTDGGNSTSTYEVGSDPSLIANTY